MNSNMHNLKNIVCAECKCRFAIPVALYEAALCSDSIVFYCPYGHDLRFPKPEEKTPEEKDNVVQLHIVKKDDARSDN